MFRNSLIAFGLRGAGAVLWLAYATWLARQLSGEAFGIALYAINTATLVAGLLTAGYGQAMLRLGAPAWAEGRAGDFRRLLMRALLGLVAGSAVLAGALALGAGAGAGADTGAGVGDFGNLLYAAPGLPALTVAMALVSGAILLQASALRAMGDLRIAITATSIHRLWVPLALTVLAGLVWPPGAVEAAGAFALGVGLVACWMLWLLAARLRAASVPDTPLEPPVPDRRAERRTVGWLWLVGIGRVIEQNADALLVGFLLGAVEAGLYLAAKRVAAIGVMVADAVRVVAGPRLAVLHAAPDTAPAFREAAAMAGLLFLALVGGACAGLAVLGWALLALFGPAFTGAFPLLLVMVAGLASFAVFGPVGLLMTMTRLERARALITLASAAAACLAVIWLAPRFGPIGVAWAFAAVTILSNAASSAICWRVLGIPPAAADPLVWQKLRRGGWRAVLRALRGGKGGGGKGNGKDG